MSGQRPGGPEMRIGDAEREAAVAALGEHYASGRLTKEEFDERTDRAYAARTRSALWPLFADLPPTGAPRSTTDPRRQPPALPGAWAGGWAGGWAPRVRPASPQWWKLVLVPVLLVVLVVSVLTHLPFFLLLLFAWLVLGRVGRHRSCGPRQRPRGSWERRP